MRALIVSHGQLAAELLASARSICALDAPVEALSNEGHGPDELRAAIQAWIEAAPGDALVLVDAGGGSCGIAARLAVARCGRPDVRVLGGANLPMVLALLSSLGELDPSALVEKLLARARGDVADLGGGALT